MSDDMTFGQYAKLIAQAKLGLEALIDETTGYQEVRPPDALRKRYAEFGGDEKDYTAPDRPPAA